MPANRQTVPRADREAEIVEAARAEFLAACFDDATVASIARRAGMTSANVHYYFATKESLFAAVARRTYEQLFDTLDAMPEPMGRLRTYVEFHLAHHSLRAEVQAVAARSAELADVLARREAWLVATVAELVIDELDAAAMTAVVTGLIESVVPHPQTNRVLDHAAARFAQTTRRSRR